MNLEKVRRARRGRAPIELSYTRDAAGAEQNPTIRIEYTNASRPADALRVLALTELYGVGCLTTGARCCCSRGSGARAGPDGEPFLRTFVPDGRANTTDLIKLLASTEPFDAQALQQDELTPARDPGRPARHRRAAR